MKRIYILSILAVCLTLPASAQRSNKTKQLSILQTSDMHSRVEPIDVNAADRNAGMGGMVRRMDFIEEARQSSPDLLLFDCGDFSQGTPYYNLFQGEVEVKMMNLMKYDAMVIGNHEFDFGLENMARLFRLAKFPILCANYDVKGTVLEGLVKPYIILERGGLKIGVFGVSPEMEGLVQADKYEGVGYNDPITVAQEMADLLKKQCDVVICLSHLGFNSDEALVQKTTGIDVILGGHSHTFMKEATIYLNKEGKNVPILHTGGNAVYVGSLKLTLTKK